MRKAITTLLLGTTLVITGASFALSPAKTDLSYTSTGYDNTTPITMSTDSGADEAIIVPENSYITTSPEANQPDGNIVNYTTIVK